MANLRVLIVGASIAGPTAAYWLAKAGATITVIERYPSLRTGGQAIDIRTCGVAVMRRTPGMESAVRAKKTELEGLSFVRSDGTSYGTLRPTGNPDQQTLVSEYEIFRGDLGKILVDLSMGMEGVKYVFGEQVSGIRQSAAGGEKDGPVTVEFQNGMLPTSEYDLVVACDGATSRTRGIGLECGVRDHIIPINSWAAYCSVPKDYTKGSKIGLGFSAVGGRAVMVGPDPKGSTVCFMNINPRDNRDLTLPFREAVKQGDEALKMYITKRYADVGWITPQVLKDILDSDDLYATELVQVKVPALSKGRFVLVGDAGYCPGPTGGGTTLAMTGAYVLAGEICKHNGDLAAGLAGYEKTMRPIITDLQKIPPGVLTLMAPQTNWGIWMRNHIFMFITWSGIVGFLSKYFSAAFAEGEKHKLPEYEWVR